MEELLRPALMLAVFVLMLAVGMDCTRDGFRSSIGRPGLLAAATLVQYLCIPALFLGTVFLLGLSPVVATALLLVAACPSGTISNAYTFLARGNTALSVTLTAVSNLVAFFATPLALSAVAYFASEKIADSLTFPPGPLLRQLAVSMVLPLALGVMIRIRFPDLVLQNLKNLRRFCVVLIVAVVVLTVLADPQEVARYLGALIVPVLVVTPCLFALALVVVRAFRASDGDRRAILFELPCRNVALAMLIALSVLERPELAYVSVAFFILESTLLLVLAAVLVRVAERGDQPISSSAEA